MRGKLTWMKTVLLEDVQNRGCSPKILWVFYVLLGPWDKPVEKDVTMLQVLGCLVCLPVLAWDISTCRGAESKGGAWNSGTELIGPRPPGPGRPMPFGDSVFLELPTKKSLQWIGSNQDGTITGSIITHGIIFWIYILHLIIIFLRVLVSRSQWLAQAPCWTTSAQLVSHHVWSLKEIRIMGSKSSLKRWPARRKSRVEPNWRTCSIF